MKTILTTLTIICLSFYSCGDSNNKAGNDKTNKSTTSSDVDKTNTAGENQDNKTTVQKENNTPSETSQNNEGIRVQFPAGATQVTLNGNIKGLGDNITYVFEVSEGQKLNATVTPSTQGNIRFNQIIDPSGDADGPFGNQMTYSLNQSGDWKLVVGESNMLGEPYVGEYNLTIQIK